MTMKATTTTVSPPPPLSSSSSSSSLVLSPLFLLSFILSMAVLYCTTGFTYFSSIYYFNAFSDHHVPKVERKVAFAMGEADEGCVDLFEGKWVRDDGGPPYEEGSCPYLDQQTTCLRHGRPDKEYRYWRWSSSTCSIPSFNSTLMLEALRGKRMMFVGDSLNRGQFISMICLLQRAIPPHAHSIEVFHSLTVFTAKEYNARVEFYWAPFLFESNADDPIHHHVVDRIIRNGSMEKHGGHWKGAHILVFNTYIWWVSGLKLLVRGSLNDKVKNVVPLERDEGYRMAIKELVEWIDRNIDAKTKRVFFISMSPTHQWSYKWGGDPEGNCYKQTRMIENSTYFAAEKSLMDITVEEISRSRAVPVTLLNITHLSSVRKDAHVSIYKKQSRPLIADELAKPETYADCIHWCLPGLPDIWNQLLFAKLFYP
ncbi:protein trichome birefringence-like 33 [Andrographis paniculata]|uniref:protein trichome birefringence-like 33 n=1 Tax=Andrographis paniculata TaxID=175694 RepID=UPI0021E6E4EF|nr:protein trichome birefringence-like 33 [Andrographis paniculata]